jgi:two-component system copper resistance phosphate regulon response regulator CusR
LKSKILYVEDEVKTALSVTKGLEENGFEVVLTYDGASASKAIESQKFDLYILDYILPDESGLDLCKAIRQQGILSPILFLTALDSTQDKVIVFDAGADDYLVKPFEFKELVARIKSLLRRSGNDWSVNNVLSYSDLELNMNTRIAMRQGKQIELTAREFKLLEWMMKNKERVISKTEIEKNVWNIFHDTSSNVVEVYMNFLRKKIDKEFDKKLIHTLIGQGYILKSTE